MMTAPPVPLLSGYAVDPQDQCLRSGQFEVGTGRVRRISTARFSRVNVQWVLRSDAEMDDFVDWFHRSDGANGGQAWFQAPLALGGDGVATYDARFSGPYKATPLAGLRWSVTATLEVRNA